LTEATSNDTFSAAGVCAGNGIINNPIALMLSTNLRSVIKPPARQDILR
jgi:hypothetical protein